MARYIVRAAQIVVEVSDARHEVYMLRGARLPETATEASIAHLLDRGLIFEQPEPAPEPDAPEQPGEKPKPRSRSKAQPAPAADVAELLKQAAERGIEVPEGVTERDDLIALLEQ